MEKLFTFGFVEKNFRALPKETRDKIWSRIRKFNKDIDLILRDNDYMEEDIEKEFNKIISKIND